jgi:hypothetical protein
MGSGRFLRECRLVPPLLLVACLGCAHVPQQSETMQNAQIEASSAELRTRVVELGREMIREVEIAADSIDARNADVGIRRSTLLWRLSTVSEATEVALRANPVHAMIDLYALRLQMDGFLSSAAGYASFGADAVLGRRAMARLAKSWEEAAEQIQAEFSDENRAAVQRWADAHPLDRLPFTRTSLLADLATTLRSQPGSIGAAVGGIQGTLDRLEYRASFLNESAVKQGMWISQLAAYEVRSTPEASELTRTLTGTRTLVEDAPELMERERSTILADVERQRVETLAALAQERAIVLQALASERALILQAADAQRRLLMQDVDSLRLRAEADAIRVVDHLMLRVAQLTGALLALGVVGLLILRRRAWASPRGLG